MGAQGNGERSVLVHAPRDLAVAQNEGEIAAVLVLALSRTEDAVAVETFVEVMLEEVVRCGETEDELFTFH